jgi:hypothetical protein
MRKALLFAAVVLLAGCMSPEERKIADYINGRVKDRGEHVSSVEIIRTDSLLSFTPLQIMYNECLRKMSTGEDCSETAAKMGVYYYHMMVARSSVLDGKWQKIEGHDGEWRRVDKVKIKYDGIERDDYEVVYDVDGTIMMMGREYDDKLNEWQYKVQSIQ